MTKDQLIKSLHLEPHPSEGGYFSRTYTSETVISVSYDTKPRSSLSSIFYMLTDDSPIGYLHKNKSDIIHYYHCGAPVIYWILHPDGRQDKIILGDDIANGQQLQLTVKAGCWKASELEHGKFGLISEAVSPGFEYEDMELASCEVIESLSSGLASSMKKFIK